MSAKKQTKGKPPKKAVKPVFNEWEERAIPALKAADILLNEVWFSGMLEYLLENPLRTGRSETCHVIERVLNRAKGEDLLTEQQHYGFRSAQEALLAFETACHCGLEEGFSEQDKKDAWRNRDICEGHVGKAIGLAVQGIRVVGVDWQKERLSAVIGLTKESGQ